MAGTPHPSTLVGEGDPARARFQEMVTAEMDTLYRLALHFTRNRTDAEDLVQDTFVRAWRSFHTFQPGTNPRAWLATILRHAYFDRYRRGKQEPALVDVEDIDEFNLYGHVSAAPEFRREAGDPATAFFAALPSDQVASTLHALRPHYREVFVLADLAGFSYREISEIVGIPEGTVMSRLHRARQGLQKALWDYCLSTGQCRAPAAVPAPSASPDCSEACRQIYGCLDRALDPAALAQVDDHLRSCRQCCDRLEFQRRLTVTIENALGTAEVPDRLRAQVRSVVTRF
jgi:RNA polymerase sigma-70 factor (ECF subfamily)